MGESGRAPVRANAHLGRRDKARQRPAAPPTSGRGARKYRVWRAPVVVGSCVAAPGSGGCVRADFCFGVGGGWAGAWRPAAPGSRAEIETSGVAAGRWLSQLKTCPDCAN